MRQSLGHERQANSLLHFEDEDEFVHWFPTSFPAAPDYFFRMRTFNQRGPSLRLEIKPPEPLSAEAKRAITESFLGAWLDKNRQYPVGQYFRVGQTGSTYAPRAGYGNISGGKVWEAASSFMAAGVNPGLIGQLQKWGTSYTNTAARFAPCMAKSV